ncbi:hypothetical protein TREMEDRAFT_61174 [Tremella mesenterica DSM 1558]|uniref:uncharacterized protein n=1 Tax=Tremella mesenterica (strain ATCC 24925 / CBS 8224 / DSM 1558 / NBRC 9311 / NRRL Y-6157 / RJB 2259-6 / UBC 559-6) TaxID=578456 RepID=UPI0003F4A631|nr:uncharacterized protein TREMEDRAFT_61174 [Tremella mesenterica DSM 1558]EIW70666.1 hypothetical protein TREMEDRAFT_61174 [Tremella mesenterica DSM 1558]
MNTVTEFIGDNAEVSKTHELATTIKGKRRSRKRKRNSDLDLEHIDTDEQGLSHQVYEENDVKGKKHRKREIAKDSSLENVTKLDDVPVQVNKFEWDVKIFHGAGIYASDSFRIFSDLLPGGGAPRDESKWLHKRTRAMERASVQVRDDSVEMDWRDCLSEDENVFDQRIEGKGKGIGREDVLEGLSIEEREEWRLVRPFDKELRRYLIWRWGLEGIEYDILLGPSIISERDKSRLRYLL